MLLAESTELINPQQHPPDSGAIPQFSNGVEYSAPAMNLRVVVRVPGRLGDAITGLRRFEMRAVVRAEDVVQVVARVHLEDEHVRTVGRQNLAEGQIRLQWGVASSAVREHRGRMAACIERRLEHSSGDLVILSTEVG